MRLNKFYKFLINSVIGLVLLTSTFLVSNVFAANNNDNKVTICHATSSHSNPYIVNNPNASGDVSGHDGHDGPIWPATNSSGDWGDIIPPFSYNDQGQTFQYPGKNWTSQGQAIWNNGCQIPSSSPSPSPSPSIAPSVSPSVSLSPSPSSSASASPSVSPSPSPSPVASSSPSASSQPQGGTGTSSTPTPSSDNSSSNGSSSGSNSGNVSNGEVLGASTLAPTGTTENLMTFLFGMGILLILGSNLKYAQAKN